MNEQFNMPWKIQVIRLAYAILDGSRAIIAKIPIADGSSLGKAHLIAAAPDLYEALLKWQAYDDQDEADFSQHGPMLLYAEAIEATRAALARARGES